MEDIFNDSAKIHKFAQIQDALCELKANSNDEEINKIINLIPRSYLAQKDDLKLILFLFAYYTRNNLKNIRGNGIKLIEKIMTPIKTLLKDESVFIWNIFGGLYFFKQWMYEEGLISIDVIIQAAINDTTFSIAEYFLPEIIESSTEIFEKVFKNSIKTPYSKEYINELIELRKKHFKWLRDSNDYNDPIYREIEKNPLRLCIKTDDIEQFQSIVSNLNLPLDTKIGESFLENSYFDPYKISLIDFAIEFNAIKIFKYLLMNGAKIEAQSTFNSIRSRNYEMIHIVESENELKFKEYVLVNGISTWNDEIINYAIENYDFDFFEKENVSSDKSTEFLNVINNLCYSVNFHFLETIFIPFIKKNPDLLKLNINEVLIQSLEDPSCYFLKEFLKFKGEIDINYHSKKENDKSILVKAICLKNLNAVEILLNHPDTDIKRPGFDYFLPFHFACGCNTFLDIIKAFCNDPKLNINWRDNRRHLTALNCCVLKGNFYAFDYILNHFPDLNEKISISYIYHCISKNYLMIAKLLLKRYMIQNEDMKTNEIIRLFKGLYANNDNEEDDDDYVIILKQLLNELNSK